MALDELQKSATGGDDIVLSERISGVPAAVINTPWHSGHGALGGPHQALDAVLNRAVKEMTFDLSYVQLI
jgi:NAD(P)H-dependent flavin oxidoreductase YrpB (nitropropane dioxygenase family)